MECEAGRCRRTDGRKWRCSKSVILGQKYCERHMHRGRRGSRKRVEPKSDNIQIPDDNNNNKNNNRRNHVEVEPTEPVTKSDNNNISAVPLVTTGIDSRIKGDCNPAQSCCSNGNPTIGDKSCDALVVVDSAIIGLEANKSDNGGHTRASTGTNPINNCDALVHDTDGKKSGFGNVNHTKISRRKPSVTRNSYDGFVSPGLGLSPNSVLHSSAVVGKPGLDEQQRCRRTDGKKWQCRRDSVPGQKYCEAHMHRGAKRVMLNPEYASNVQNTSAQSTSYISGNCNCSWTS